MIKGLFTFGGELFWTVFWVFVILIIGFASLSFLANKFNGGVVGGAASWVETHASPRG